MTAADIAKDILSRRFHPGFNEQRELSQVGDRHDGKDALRAAVRHELRKIYDAESKEQREYDATHDAWGEIKPVRETDVEPSR